MPQAPTPVKRYHETLLQTVRDIGLHQKWFTSPINLGGVGGAGGGSGIPIGGIIGQLIQTKVAYDTTEAAILNPPVSGRSLLDNLNTIRHRINVAGEPLIVEEDNVEKASGVVYLNFIGDILVTSPSADRVNVSVVTGGGSVLGGVVVIFEDLTSQILPANNFYLVNRDIASGTAQVYINGLIQKPTNFTEVSSGVTLTETLVGTDEVLIEYLTSGGTVTGLGIFADGVLIGTGAENLDFVDVQSVTISGVTAIITLSGASGGDPHTLGSTTHTDVIITGVTDNEVLAYDTGSSDWINQTPSEASLSAIGHTHIETDITDLSHDIEVQEEDATKLSAATILNFEGGVNVVDEGGGKATITISGGSGSDEKAKVSSNDTTTDFLEQKIVAGSNVNITVLNEGANEQLEISSTASGSAGDPKVTIFTVEGEISVNGGNLRMYNKWGRSISITSVFIAVNTAPTGADLIVDINKGGTSIFTTQSKRPLIVDGGFTDTSDTPDIQTWESDSYLTMDVDQVGSTVVGSDLVVHVIGD